MTISLERFVRCSFSLSEGYLAAYFDRAAHGGFEGVMRVPFFGHRTLGLSKMVEIDYSVTPDHSEGGRPHDGVTVNWRSPSRLLPAFEGRLRTRIHMPGTDLLFEGRYSPPFGAFGRLFDAIVGRMLARATMRDLLARLATDMEAKEVA
ncbi:MAG: hypothetical protein GIW95_05215 [Candidatus Eremiobacteraeota bacterium]|nr:hypothetical protein [Candidatus Eremiobacteraeota bacterium]